VIPVGAAILSPPVVNRILGVVLRLLRRPPLDQRVGGRGLAIAVFWAVLGWILNGLMLYILMGRLVNHGVDVALVSVGGFALAWVVGFLAIFAPAGAGVRDAIMVAVLATQTTTSVALVVALVSRALSVMADAVTGAGGIAVVRRKQLAAIRDGSPGVSPTPDAPSNQG
jgi:uncharacterized membrane protein YbhN (UPF0104 family)